MTISMASLVNTVNQLINAPEPKVEPKVRKVGSLQEHLLSISRHALVNNANVVSELSVGPPPMYRKDQSTNVVTLPKRQGSRVIIWSQVKSSTHAA
jgi:hypothetical protein